MVPKYADYVEPRMSDDQLRYDPDFKNFRVQAFYWRSIIPQVRWWSDIARSTISGWSAACWLANRVEGRGGK